MKENLLNIMLSETESNYSSDIDVNAITDSEQEISDQEIVCQNGLCHCNSINMITKEKEFLIDMAEKIPDPEVRKEYLLKLKDLVTEKIVITQLYKFSDIKKRFKEGSTSKQKHESSIQDLQEEINNIKIEISEIKANQEKTNKKLFDMEIVQTLTSQETIQNSDFINHINKVTFQKWFVTITIVINDEYHLNSIALIDTGADQNCIQEGLIPTKYYEKTSERLSAANGSKLSIKYKLTKAKVCNQGFCISTPFILVKGLSCPVILGTPFITTIYPFHVDYTGITANILGKNLQFKFIFPMAQKELQQLQQLACSINLIQNKQKHIQFLKQDLNNLKIQEQLEKGLFQNQQKEIEDKFNDVCSSVPNAFWDRKRHIVTLPYIPEFDEKFIPTRARAIHMNEELEQTCRKEI